MAEEEVSAVAVAASADLEEVVSAGAEPAEAGNLFTFEEPACVNNSQTGSGFRSSNRQTTQNASYAVICPCEPGTQQRANSSMHRVMKTNYLI